MEHLTYKPSGVCSRQFDIDYEDGKIVAISIKNVTKKVRAFLYDGRKDKKDGK